MLQCTTGLLVRISIRSSGGSGGKRKEKDLEDHDLHRANVCIFLKNICHHRTVSNVDDVFQCYQILLSLAKLQKRQ